MPSQCLNELMGTIEFQILAIESAITAGNQNS